MAKSSSLSDTHFPPAPPDELDDNVKRCIIVGMCLHTYISPHLRTYVNAELEKQYHSLVTSHHIEKQIFASHQPTLPSLSNVKLNYATINNNKTKFGKKTEKYDYEVKNAIDLSKLFLQPHLADYTAFDSKCDWSALIGLIKFIQTFHQDVREDMEKIRVVRNQIAHPDFEEWSPAKYAESFTLLRHLMMNLALDSDVTNNVIGRLNIWETNGINFLSGTPLGLELYQFANEVLHNEAVENDERHRMLESRIDSLKNDVDRVMLAFKTGSEDVEKSKIVTERIEYDLKSFPGAEELQTIIKASIDQLGNYACLPEAIHDVIEKKPQAIFCYQIGSRDVNYQDFTLMKVGKSVTKTERFTTHPVTTVCILEGTSEGNLTNEDILVLKALLDLPDDYMENAMFIVRNFSSAEEHLNRKVLYNLSEKISSELNLIGDVNTVFTRLYSYKHVNIASKMSMSFQRQMLDSLLAISDRTLNDIITSEKFLTSEKFNECKEVFNDSYGPLSESYGNVFLKQQIKRYQHELNAFVLAELEKKLRSSLCERLNPNLPTHEWADLSKRTRSSIDFLKDDIGDVFSSDYVKFLRQKVVLKRDDIINLEIADCRETHLKEIRRVKNYLQKTFNKMLCRRIEANKNNNRFQEVRLVLKRIDPKSEVSFVEGRYIIRLANHARISQGTEEFLILFLQNLNNIEFKELESGELTKFAGTLKSGDRITGGSWSPQYSTASFFLRDSQCFYLVACQHITEPGKPVYINYTKDTKYDNVRAEHILNFEDIGMAVFRILDDSIICKSGIRSDLDTYFSLDGHVLTDDMMTLPVGSQVYKWGAGSGLTYGKLVGVSIGASKKYVEVYIEEDKTLPFAIPGDSGSVVCFKTELEKVYAAFVIIGTFMTHVHSHITSYACVMVDDVLSHISGSYLGNLKFSFSDSSLCE